MTKIGYMLKAFVVLLIFSASTAQANMRAPQKLPEHGGSSLKESDKQLIVQKENLSFQCNAYSCAVEANYTVLSSAAGTFDLQFISASSQLPTADINGNAALVSIKQIESSSPGHSYHDSDRVTPTWNAMFRAELKAGENQIVVRHLQPLGLSELGPNYFFSSHYTADFHYEAWPLKEWRLAPDFSMSLQIIIDEKRRLFQRRPSVKCYGNGKDDTEFSFSSREYFAIPIKKRAKKKTFFAAKFGMNFPDRIWCSIKSKETKKRGKEKFNFNF